MCLMKNIQNTWFILFVEIATPLKFYLEFNIQHLNIYRNEPGMYTLKVIIIQNCMVIFPEPKEKKVLPK